VLSGVSLAQLLDMNTAQRRSAATRKVIRFCSPMLTQSFKHLDPAEMCARALGQRFTDALFQPHDRLPPAFGERHTHRGLLWPRGIVPWLSGVARHPAASAITAVNTIRSDRTTSMYDPIVQQSPSVGLRMHQWNPPPSLLEICSIIVWLYVGVRSTPAAVGVRAND
jgi:hypothetical protein